MRKNVPIEEIDLKEVPITIETAHQFFNKRQMRFIVTLKKDEYKQGYKNGMMINKAILLLLFTSLSFAQSGIVVAGKTENNISYTIGPGLVELQISEIEEITLGVPSFEIEPPKKAAVIKKKSLFEKIIEFIKQLITKKPKTK